MLKRVEARNQSYVSWIVFLATLVMVVLSLISVVFPAFLSIYSEPKFPQGINPFETGIWTFPLLITNFALLGIGILYFKNKIPKQITKSIKFIFDFEVSTKVAFLTILIILGFYITLSVDELLAKEPWEDFERTTKSALEQWSFEDITRQIDFHLMVKLLGNISMAVFGSYRVIPLMASVALLILTYAVTTKIAKKRFSGLVSMVLVLQSSNFLTYDTLITYSNFWVVFYIFSLYLVYNKWHVSPISFIFSMLSKPLSILFLPMSAFFVYRASIAKRKKIQILTSYGIIVLLGISFLVITDTNLFTIKFDSYEFLSGFGSFSSQFRFDGLIVLFLLPLVVGLFISSRRGNLQADSILVLIMSMLLLAAIISGFTSYTNSPYRFVPLVVFFAMGVGTILSKDYFVRSNVETSQVEQTT